MTDRRSLLLGLSGALLARPVLAAPEPAWDARLIAAAERQVGRTLIYDPAYVRLAYPGGDVPLVRGVCCDVVVRAYRDGLGLDLQKLVHEDMSRHFAAYPRAWGLRRPDPNIDHRRVLNLETFFRRQGASLPQASAADYRPGDLATMRLPGALPHIVLVTRRRAASGRLLCVHNVGRGAQLEDVLDAWPRVGRFRWTGPA
ncbi:MAG: DUF1287 domain-containing protein [Caulobacteraceae bacterium]|nr:DUF1287 domain-containing protein [Caulobacteraceae bacterium]